MSNLKGKNKKEKRGWCARPLPLPSPPLPSPPLLVVEEKAWTKALVSLFYS